MDTSASLKHEFSTSWNEFLQALVSASFYVELLTVGISLAISYLIALLIRGYTRRRINAMHVSPVLRDLTTHATALLWPVISIIMLTGAAPFVAEYFKGDVPWIAAAISFSVAWLAARIVLLMVKTRAIAWFITIVLFLYTALNASGFMKPSAEYLAGFSFELGHFQLSMLGLIKGAIIFVIVFWLAAALSRALEKQLKRTTALSYNSRELIAKFFTVFVYFIAFVTTLGVMGVDLTALAVFGGAMGVGVGLGLQKLTANFVSGVAILMEKSVKIGDLIEVEGQTGTVRQLHMRYALIETADGRDILIPNEQLMSSRVTNWTYSNDLARIDIRLVVDHESDARRARELMLDYAKAHPLCQTTPEPQCWFREMNEQGCVMLLVFWIPDIRDGRYTPQSEVLLTIRDAFQKEGISVFKTPNRV